MSYRSGRFEVDSDGTKFGAGGFVGAAGTISFEILPKTSEFEIAALLEAIKALDSEDKIISFGESIDDLDFQTDSSDNLTLAFLQRISDEIESFDVRNLRTFSSRELVRTGAAIRGRPDSTSIVRSITRSSLQIDCHILDNYRQRLFATLFYLTLREVRILLASWGHVKGDDRYTSKRDQKIANLEALALPIHLDYVLNATRQAPFPFGTKVLAKECSRFWRLYGRFGIDDRSSGLGFVTMAVDAAKAFEIYALAYFARLFPGYEQLSGAEFSYELRAESPLDVRTRSIKPDHLMYDAVGRHLVALEVKYSLDLGARSHISQIMTYLNYDSYPFEFDLRQAFLIYPGTEFRRWNVGNFNSSLEVVTIPVSVEALDLAGTTSP